MAIHIIDEANRCLNCKKPRCMEGCPVHTPIPHIIQMFKEHKVMDAGAELFQNNPMSVICSIVCDHEQQCAGHCVLGKKGNPVHFSSIENYISDTYLDRMKLQIPEEKKKPVGSDRGRSGRNQQRYLCCKQRVKDDCSGAKGSRRTAWGRVYRHALRRDHRGGDRRDLCS